MNLFRQEHCTDAKADAQRNLLGRTHYVDAMRFHKSRVVAARVVDNGLLYAITTTDALDMHNTKRGYRFVIFDLFGTVINRPELKDSYRTCDACDKAMWNVLNNLNAEQITLDAIAQAEKHHQSEMQLLRETLAQIKLKTAGEVDKGVAA